MVRTAARITLLYHMGVYFVRLILNSYMHVELKHIKHISNISIHTHI